MKSIKINDNNVVLTLNHREIVTICTALCTLELDYLKDNLEDKYLEVSKMYSELFELQFSYLF